MDALTVSGALPLPALLGFVALVVLVTAILMLRISSRLAAGTGLASDAEVLASDTGQNRVARLEDPALGLRGQPDYLLRESVGLLGRRKIVPVEVKPTRQRREPYEGDVMQLVVYMLLVRRKFGRKFAGYGYIRYRDRTFKVKLTPELEASCLAYADLVREARRLGSHDLESLPLPCRCGRCP